MICEFSGDFRRYRGSTPPLNNQRAITPPAAGRPRHPWLDSPRARRPTRPTHHSWIDTKGQHGRRRHTVSTSRGRRRSGNDSRGSSVGGPAGHRDKHRSSRGGRYQHNDLSGSGGSPDDWRSSPSNTDEHRDKMVVTPLLVIMVVQRFGVGLVIERSLVRLPAGALSSQLGQLSLPSLRGR